MRQYVRTGDWLKWKLPHYLCVKDELCFLGYLVLQGNRLVILQSTRDDVLCLAHEGHQGTMKTKNCLRAKEWWPKMNTSTEKHYRSFFSIDKRPLVSIRKRFYKNIIGHASAVRWWVNLCSLSLCST